jgi:hypothetical protein
MMRERGLSLDHLTIYRWVQAHAPELEKRIRPHLVIDEPHNVSDPFSSGEISIKSMEGLPARGEIDARCRRATRRRRGIESSIRRRGRRRIIREWALLPQDRIFGMDRWADQGENE